MGERGHGSSHQRGHPRKDGLPVKRQLRPSEIAVLSDLRSLIAEQQSSLIGLDSQADAEKIRKIREHISFNKLQLRNTQARFGQPVDPE